MEVPHLAKGSMVPAHPNITVVEENRATVWCCAEEIPELEHYATSNYLSKGVDASVVGVFNAKGDRNIGYAVFVEAGFLTPIEPE